MEPMVFEAAAPEAARACAARSCNSPRLPVLEHALSSSVTGVMAQFAIEREAPGEPCAVSHRPNVEFNQELSRMNDAQGTLGTSSQVRTRPKLH
jgi:hypothetical protein